MISTASEYEIALKQLTSLESRLARLQAESAAGAKGYTKAGVRKMIAKIHEELAVYEASSDSAQIES